MRLRTLESFNLIRHGLLYSYPSLQDNRECEIVVVGAGITGALIADALCDLGYKVVVIDRRDVGQGSTSATTSLLQYEVDVQLADLREMIGKQGADLCYLSGIDAIKEMKKLIESKIGTKFFQDKQSLYLAHNKKAVKKLKKEFEARQEAGIDVQWMEENDLKERYGIVSPAAIYSQCAGSIDAYYCAHELFEFNTQRGLEVFDQCEINQIEFKDDRNLIRMKNGAEIQCQKVIYCTGFESLELIKDNIARLFDTYACVSERNISINDNLKETLVWDTAKPYMYMRTTDDGRLLLGGGDEKHAHDRLKEKYKHKKALQIQNRFEELCPNTVFIEDFVWGGTFGSTKDGLPYIGEHKSHPESFFVLGFGGNGITFSIQARWLLKAWLNGTEHPLAQYYRFGR